VNCQLPLNGPDVTALDEEFPPPQVTNASKRNAKIASESSFSAVSVFTELQ
jgi:hypothetical protein